MDSFLVPGLISVTVMSLAVAALYLYLFLKNTDRMLQLWSAAWGVYSMRFFIQTSIVLKILPPWMVVLQEAATLTASFLCIAGAKALTDNTVASWWRYGAVISICWVVFAQIVQLPFFWADLPVSFFTGLLFFWSGIIILRQTQISGPGRTVSGYALILWGIHRADYTFLRPVAWFAPWGFLLAAVLFLIAAIGILLLYYDKIRGELEREIHHRKLAQESLSASEEDLKESQRIARLGSWRLNVLTNQVVWSKELYRMYGFNPELPPPPYTEHQKLFTAESWEKLSKALDRTKKEGIPYELELKTVRKDGSHGWMWGYAEALRDANGTITMLRGAAQDITEQKRTIEDLRLNEGLLSNAQKLGHMGSWVLDLKANHLTWSEETYRIFGMKPQGTPLNSKAIFEIIHPDDRALVDAAYKNSFKKSNDGYELEYRIVRRDNAEISNVFEKCIHEKDDTGGIVRSVGIVQDITERKRFENELLKSENRMRTIFNEAPLGIALIDSLTGKIYEMNPRYAEIAGRTLEEMIALDWMSITHPGDVQKDLDNMALLNAGKITGFNMEKRYIKPDESVVWINMIIAPVAVDDPAQPRHLAMIEDITSRKQAHIEKEKLENQLRQAQKRETIGNLASGIAHDFNNMLCPIIGMSEMLLEDLPKDSLEHENASEIFQAGKRAADLVQQILAFSRQSEHKMKPVRVQNVLKDVLKLSRSTIPSNIKIQENIQQNCGLVMADATQIHQVAMNLITNAYHAVEHKNGVIDVELKEIIIGQNEPPCTDLLSGRYVRLKVSDNGIGMTPGTIQKIFEPYFTTKEKGKGTGLGLSVVYGIVKGHKGDIQVYSEAHKETAFCIYLPLMKKATEAVSTEQISSAQTGTERILFVDDQAQVAKLVGQMISRLGYQVTVITSSEDALNAFRSDPDSFDLVLSDMTMPNMTGDKLAEEILSIKPNKPIIICTGFSERISKEQADLMGIKGLLMKPVLKSELAQMLRKVLDEAKNP